MNIIETEAGSKRYKEKDRKVTYIIIDKYHSLSINKKDILWAELDACRELLIDTTNDTDRKFVQKEITQLEAILGMIS